MLQDNTLKLWDSATGQPTRSFVGHTAAVLACCFSAPDGELLLSAGMDTTLRLWRCADGSEALVVREHSAWVNACSVSPDGLLLCSGAGSVSEADYTVKVYSAACGSLRHTLEGHTSEIMCCTFSPDSARVASGAGYPDSSVRVWDAASGALLHALVGHGGRVWCLAFSPAGDVLASGSRDETLRLWDAADGALRGTLSGHQGGVLCCAFAPTTAGRPPNSASGVDQSRIIVSGSADRTIKTWDMTLTGPAPSSPTAGEPAGSTEVPCCCGAASYAVRRRGGQGGEGSAEALEAQQRQHSGAIRCCAFSPEGSGGIVATAGGDAVVKLWSSSSGELLRTLRGHAGPVNACCFSPCGRTLLTASDDRTLALWRAATGVRKRALVGHTGQPSCCAYSADGAAVLSGATYCAETFDSDTALRLWDAATGRLQLALRGHRGYVRACAFSPCGQMLLSASDDRTLVLWDRSTGAPRAALEGHAGTVWACAFSPASSARPEGGQFVVSASSDGTLRLWEHETATLRASLGSGAPGYASGCAWVSSGLIVSASAAEDGWGGATWWRADDSGANGGGMAFAAAERYFPSGRLTAMGAAEGSGAMGSLDGGLVLVRQLDGNSLPAPATGRKEKAPRPRIDKNGRGCCFMGGRKPARVAAHAGPAAELLLQGSAAQGAGGDDDDALASLARALNLGSSAQKACVLLAREPLAAGQRDAALWDPPEDGVPLSVVAADDGGWLLRRSTPALAKFNTAGTLRCTAPRRCPAGCAVQFQLRVLSSGGQETKARRPSSFLLTRNRRSRHWRGLQ